MKSFFLFLPLMVVNMLLYSQINLVQNPSFEEFSSCPTSSGEIWKANGWYGIGDVEYLNVCAPFFAMNVPYGPDNNFQYAHLGDGMCGFHPFTMMPDLLEASLYREWIGKRIYFDLQNNKKYCSSFFLNMHNGTNIPIENFDIFFSPDSIFYVDLVTEVAFPKPQVSVRKGIIADTLNWILMEGVFIAQGNEKYMIIGNFEPNDSVNYTILDWPAWSPFCPFGANSISYYFIDDVSLYELTKLPTAANHAYNCAAQTVTLRCDTGFNYRWYYLPDTINVLSTADTFVVYASTAKNVLLRATLCSTEFADTVLVPKLDCTGLEDNLLAQGAAVFPNPASRVATFSLQGTPPPGTRLHLSDLNGRELRTYAITGKTTELDLSGLSGGVYFVSYRFKENTIWKGKMCILDEK